LGNISIEGEQDEQQKVHPLLEKTTLANFNFGRKIGELCADPSVFEDIFQGVTDGTIDPGDQEDATKRMTKFLIEMLEYEEMMEVHRKNRKQLAEMYSELAKASENEYVQYMEALQRISIAMAVDNALKALQKEGIVEDKR
jgi:hypothetical protein